MVNIGTDPEYFIYDKLVTIKSYRYPNIIPPAALVTDYGLKLTEENGKKVLLKEKEFSWTEDGAAIELQVTPSTTPKDFFSKVISARHSLKRFLVNHKLELYEGCVGYFDVNKYWKGRDESFRNCVIFGCDPDVVPETYLTLGLDKEPEQLDVSKHTFRYAGGHIHIQAPEDIPTLFYENYEMLQIAFDFTLGLGSIKNRANRLFEESQRLKYYGKPGRIRLQIYNKEKNLYGIEYRSLSNSWVNKLGEIERNFYMSNLLVESALKGILDNFIGTFYDDIFIVYDAMMSLNEEVADSYLNKYMIWFYENDLLSEKELSNIL